MCMKRKWLSHTYPPPASHPIAMPCSRERSDRLDLYAKEVADAWDANGAAAVTHALESIFRREHRFCQSIASRVKYIFYGVDN